MKTLRLVLVFVLASCTVGAFVAHAAKPKTGGWKVKLNGAATPPGGKKTGNFTVLVRKGKLYVQSFNSPSIFVKCTGSRARPEEIDPGFEGQFGTGGMNKVSKKGKVRGSFKSKTLTYGYKGKFTKKRKASGTLYYRTVTPNRKCDSGAIKWKATR